MQIFKTSNGLSTIGRVEVYVLAENGQRAIDLAQNETKRNGLDLNIQCSIEYFFECKEWSDKSEKILDEKEYIYALERALMKCEKLNSRHLSAIETQMQRNHERETLFVELVHPIIEPQQPVYQAEAVRRRCSEAFVKAHEIGTKNGLSWLNANNKAVNHLSFYGFNENSLVVKAITAVVLLSQMKVVSTD